jgi:hypothetical protein
LLECETEDAMSVSLTIGIIENGENVHWSGRRTKSLISSTFDRVTIASQKWSGRWTLNSWSVKRSQVFPPSAVYFSCLTRSKSFVQPLNNEAPGARELSSPHASQIHIPLPKYQKGDPLWLSVTLIVHSIPSVRSLEFIWRRY